MQILHHHTTCLLSAPGSKGQNVGGFVQVLFQEAVRTSAAQDKGIEPGDAQADLFLKLTTEAQQVTGRLTFYVEKRSLESISFRFELLRVEKISEHHQASGLPIYTDFLPIIFRSFSKLLFTCQKSHGTKRKNR